MYTRSNLSFSRSGLADAAVSKSHLLAPENGQRRALGELGNTLHVNVGKAEKEKRGARAQNGRVTRRTTRAQIKAEREKERARQQERDEVARAQAEAAAKVSEAAAMEVEVESDVMEVQQMMDREDMMIEENNLSLEDIDEYDREDPQFCTEYVEEIFALLREKEQTNRVEAGYMANQDDLIPSYRTKIVNWMGEVYMKFRLLSETLILAVNILDRFLMERPVSRSRLQLLGATAMLVACKFEEIYLPQIDDFVYLCADAYSRKDFLRMENIILGTLNYNLAVPTPLHFLRRFSKAAFSDRKVHTLSKYITELSLSSYELLRFLPSQVAAAAVLVARNMSGITPLWNSTLRHYTQYKESDIMECAEMLNEMIRQVHEEAASDRTSSRRRGFAHPIARKYASSRLISVANEPYTPLPQ